jgi:hypothetical protein
VRGRRGTVAGRLGLTVLFAALVVALALSLWSTVIRRPAYEIRGVLVARPSPGLLLVRHDAVAALGMSAMELMAVVGDARLIDAANVAPGDTVRLGVRERDNDLVLIRIDKIR